MKMKANTKVKITDIDYIYHPEHDDTVYEYWKQIVGQVGIYSGITDSQFYKDDDYYNYDEDNDDEDYRTFEDTYGIDVVTSDGIQRIYLFAHNFEVIKLGPVKNDIEWLDRVQLNFKY